MPIRINGLNTGSVTLSASANGGDVTLNLPNANGTVATTSYADTAPGLQYITGQTFTDVSSVSVNNCFTSTYANYRIIMRFLMSATTAELRSRLRFSGTDNSTASSYQRSGYLASATTSLAVNGGALDYLFHGATSSSGAHYLWYELMSPAITESTAMMSNFFQGTGNLSYGHQALHTQGAAYDGITLYVSSGTITGTLRIYGYRNS